MSSDGAKKNLSSHIWLISYLIFLFIVAVTGWFTTGYLGDKARQEIIEYSESIVSLHSAHFTAEFENVEKAVGILSGSPYIASALLSGKDRDIAECQLGFRQVQFKHREFCLLSHGWQWKDYCFL